jgi:hypothetical protein
MVGKSNHRPSRERVRPNHDVFPIGASVFCLPVLKSKKSTEVFDGASPTAMK